MKSTLIGYFPKITVSRPDWLKADRVLQVCSASTCLSEGPEDWINKWKHNENWLYSSPSVARSVIGNSDREWDMYAFKQFPVVIDRGEISDQEIEENIVGDLPETYEFLGYDAVSRSCGNAFECSPLSCNNGAEHMETNAFCLFDKLERALEGALEFSQGGWEPGPYYIVEVFRESGI